MVQKKAVMNTQSLEDKFKENDLLQKREQYSKKRKDIIGKLIKIPADCRKHHTYKKDILQEMNPKKSYFLYGESGRGKSVLASSWCKQLIRKNILFKWINYAKLSSKIKSSFQSHESYYEIITDISEYPGYVILDDMASESNSPIIQEATYVIINDRCENNRPVLITSNKPLEVYDTRIASRIAGMCIVYEFVGADRRLGDE